MRRTASAGPGRATSTAGPPTPPAPVWRSVWLRSREAVGGLRSRAAWRPKTPCYGQCSNLATTLSFPNDAYGGTYRLVSNVIQKWGVSWTAADTSDLASVQAALQPRTRVIWVETPTNPLLRIADIAALAGIAHGAAALLVVDNTFATPYLQQPLASGADVVVHSTTKYCGGHSDVIGGALVVGGQRDRRGARVSPERDGCRRRAVRRVAGAARPQDARRADGSALRQRRAGRRHAHRASAGDRGLYPGLPNHPGHEVAAKQMRRFGGMVSFRVEGGEDAAVEVCNRARVFMLGESLGGVESLIEHPGRMTHASVSGSPLEVPADLVRLSVGIESVEDLCADLSQALSG